MTTTPGAPHRLTDPTIPVHVRKDWNSMLDKIEAAKHMTCPRCGGECHALHLTRYGMCRACDAQR